MFLAPISLKSLSASYFKSFETLNLKKVENIYGTLTRSWECLSKNVDLKGHNIKFHVLRIRGIYQSDLFLPKR